MKDKVKRCVFYRNRANLITVFRVLLSIFMFFAPVFSLSFYIAYILCGVSDMADGFVARGTNTVSKFGERLDSIADIIFVAAAMLKVLPGLIIPRWLWIWFAGIVFIKICNIIMGFVRSASFILLHTPMNKITGLLLFLLPFILNVIDIRYSFPFVSFVATVAAVHEGYCIYRGTIK